MCNKNSILSQSKSVSREARFNYNKKKKKKIFNLKYDSIKINKY